MAVIFTENWLYNLPRVPTTPTAISIQLLLQSFTSLVRSQSNILSTKGRSAFLRFVFITFL